MDSDDDAYLSECLYQEERKISDGDITLFSRPDGLPMAFENLDFDYTLTQLIEDNGGIVVDSVNEVYKENTIKICSQDSTALNVTEEAFDKLFIYHSLKEQNIVNLSEYRLTNSGRLETVDYDPIDILCGYKGWNEIKPHEEEDKESQPELNIEFRECDAFRYCKLEEGGSLKTEDELWEAREPHQVYVSQDPEKDHLEEFEMMQEGTEHESQHSDVPTFVKSLMQGKLV